MERIASATLWLRSATGAKSMFLGIAVLLFVLWLLGFLAFHITTAAIHIVLVIAIILVVLHFFRGRRGV
jgi:hypothetical protein